MSQQELAVTPMLPEVVLEVRQGAGRQTSYTLSHVDFVVGTVPGCDLRVPGAELPALLCLVARYPGGVSLRKLTPLQVLLLNGDVASSTDLADGDQLTIGAVDIFFRIKERALPAPPAHEPSADGERATAAPQPEMQVDRPATPTAEDLAAARQVEEDRQRLAMERGELAAERTLWQERRAQLEGEVRELLQARDEARADVAGGQVTICVEEQAAFEAAQQTARAELERREAKLAADQRELENKLVAFRSQLEAKFADDQRALEARVAAEQQRLDAKLQEYQADVVRLHRERVKFEDRQQEIEQQARSMEERGARLQRESDELQEQVLQLDEWRQKLADETAELEERKRTQEQQVAEFNQRAAAVEGQQASLSVLRSRLERQREQFRADEQELQAERARQEEAAAEWTQKWQELQQLRFEIENERAQHAAERQGWIERGAVMETAVRQMRQTQEHLAREETRLAQLTAELDEKARQLAERDQVLESQLAQLVEAQQRHDADRQALRERTLHVVQGEQAREALQEQLRSRGEELTAKQKALADQVQDYQARFAALEERRSLFEEEEKQARQQLEAIRADLEARASAVQQQELELAGASERYRTQAEGIAAQRSNLGLERLRFQDEQQHALERLAQARADFDSMRREAHELGQQLPELELRGGTALDTLEQARAQLKGHLGEIHQYVRQCQEDLDGWRTRLRGDLDKLQDQEQSLRRKQDEHRITMAGFRQQLIEWQGQIGDMKRVLSRDGTRLERQQAAVDEKARLIDETSVRLARQADELQEQQRDVDDRRLEVDRHLGDMREWYRHKLRDLAGVGLVPPLGTDSSPTILPGPVAADTAVDADGEPGIVPTTRSILTLGPVDQGDQRLGDVLRDLQLVDADALRALLAEARRQRRTLRQVLLASGVITLYQLALIEAGNVQSLMLGPVRVIDRLRTTALETAYRVFDPRRGGEAVLRHLGEEQMQDAVRPDEFRQRFGQAILSAPHLVNTLEVLDIGGRPAALQEMPAGLPATDWPPLAAAPGVSYRLLTQAALGLAAAHRAGLVHGHLSDAVLLLGGDGVLKIAGLGEPAWLSGQGQDTGDHRIDLRVLGRIVSGWCTPTGVRRGARTKPLPDALVSILYRLAAEGEAGYRDVDELQRELEKAASDIPANPEAWDRLLKYIRDNTPAEGLRQSA